MTLVASPMPSFSNLPLESLRLASLRLRRSFTLGTGDVAAIEATLAKPAARAKL